jgi:hypothetical protein
MVSLPVQLKSVPIVRLAPFPLLYKVPPVLSVQKERTCNKQRKRYAVIV